MDFARSSDILFLGAGVHKPKSIVITEEDYIQFVLRMCEKPYLPVPTNQLIRVVSLCKMPCFSAGDL